MKHRICNTCNNTKNINKFYFYKSKNYYDSKCKDCRKNYNQKRRQDPLRRKKERESNRKRMLAYRIKINPRAGIRKKREKLSLEGKNICHRCLQIKLLNCFYLKSKNPNTCKMCKLLIRKNSLLNRLYNIDLDIFNLMLTAQNNKCKICNLSFNKQKDICVDHCHSTNKVRGLLCHGCNRGIGLLKEDKTILRRAINYLASPVKIPLNEESLEEDNPVLN